MIFEKPKCTEDGFSEKLPCTKYEKPKCTAVRFSERLPCTNFEKPKCKAVRFSEGEGSKNIFIVRKGGNALNTK